MEFSSFGALFCTRIGSESRSCQCGWSAGLFSTAARKATVCRPDHSVNRLILKDLI